MDIEILATRRIATRSQRVRAVADLIGRIIIRMRFATWISEEADSTGIPNATLEELARPYRP